MKRKLSLLMVLMMIVSMVPMSAFAATQAEFNAATTATLADKSEDAQGYVGGAELAVTIATSAAIEFEIGSTIEFDNRDDVELVDGNQDGVLISGNVATVTDPSKAPFNFFVELGDETGPRRVVITTGSKVVTRFYGDVIRAGSSGAELLRSKVKFTRNEEKKVASFILRSPGLENGTGKVEISLPRDFFFVTTGANATTVVGNDLVGIPTYNSDKNIMTINVNGNSNIVVNPTIGATRSASFGDVEVEIDSEDISADLVIAEYVDYTVVVKVDKEREVLAGKTQKVTVTLDGVTGAFTNRDIKFTVDGGKVKVLSVTKEDAAKLVEPTDSSKKVDEFFVRVTDPTTAKKVEMELEITPDLDSKDGELTLTVEGGGVERQTVTLVEVNARAKFETTITNVRVTDSNVMVADIVITESEAGALPVSSTTAHIIEFVGKDGMVPLFEDADVEVNGNIDVEVDVEDGKIELDVKAASRRDGSVITIKNVKITVPRSVLPGTYAVKLLAQNDAKVAQWDYVTVLEPGAIVRQRTVFTLDSAVYTVGGEERMLDAAPYISNNRTMLPIGTMAQLLGATVNYSPVTRTAVFSRDNLVVSMNLDTNILLVNGVPVMMDAKPEIQNSRAFVPVVFVAQAFGVQNNTDIVYDAAARTVTIFPNN